MSVLSTGAVAPGLARGSSFRLNDQVTACTFVMTLLRGVIVAIDARSSQLTRTVTPYLC